MWPAGNYCCNFKYPNSSTSSKICCLLEGKERFCPEEKLGSTGRPQLVVFCELNDAPPTASWLSSHSGWKFYRLRCSWSHCFYLGGLGEKGSRSRVQDAKAPPRVRQVNKKAYYPRRLLGFLLQCRNVFIEKKKRHLFDWYFISNNCSRHLSLFLASKHQPPCLHGLSMRVNSASHSSNWQIRQALTLHDQCSHGASDTRGCIHTCSNTDIQDPHETVAVSWS